MGSCYKSVFIGVVLLSCTVYASVLTVPAEHSTIQGAINAADPNGLDTIIVSPGTYVENINFNGKDIILTSTAPEDPNVVAATIIDGNAAGSVVTFSGSETSACKLRGFTITNGHADFGGGILGSYTQATIADCTINGNTADLNGGGLYVCDGTITHCTISGNAAGWNGGGLGFCNGPITDCTISGDAAGDDGGGLIYCDGLIANCTITGNTANTGGAGLSNCNGAISNSIVTGNSGRGLANCDASISNCTITTNTAGGLYGCNGPITHCTISGNTTDWGGGLSDCGGSISFCTITGNTATDYGGGLAGCNGTISNCLIAENHSDRSGGGMYQCDADVTNSTIVSNTAIMDGSGLYQCSFSGVTNSIIWDNDIVGWQTPFPDWNDPIIYTYCCYEEFTGTDSYGNIGDAPLFVDPNNGDYHLKSEYGRWDPNMSEWVFDGLSSPCIDAGNLDDTAWYNELWPHGGRVNMGAYGGTAQASMSSSAVGNIADIDHDNAVGILDLELFCEDWLYNEHLLDTDLDLNGLVDIADFAKFAAQWLWTEP